MAIQLKNLPLLGPDFLCILVTKGFHQFRTKQFQKWKEWFCMHSFLSFACMFIVCLFVCWWAHTCVWGLKDRLLVLFLRYSPPPSPYLRQGFSLMCNCTIRLGCLARKPQGSACLHFHNKEITKSCVDLLLLFWRDCGITLRLLCL